MKEHHDGNTPALYMAIFPALTGASIAIAAHFLWSVLSMVALDGSSADTRRAVAIGITALAAAIDSAAVYVVARASIARGFMPRYASPAVCSVLITLAGATVFLERYLPGSYDSITRRVSGPHGIVIVVVHLVMGWLAVRVKRPRAASGD